jgi:hypothetical protein
MNQSAVLYGSAGVDRHDLECRNMTMRRITLPLVLATALAASVAIDPLLTKLLEV